SSPRWSGSSNRPHRFGTSMKQSEVWARSTGESRGSPPDPVLKAPNRLHAQVEPEPRKEIPGRYGSQITRSGNKLSSRTLPPIVPSRLTDREHSVVRVVSAL